MSDAQPLDGGTCWKCGADRDAYGDGSRECSVCGASDEPGWLTISQGRLPFARRG